jgi:NADPH:quinone reductase-like Zn-dependent oxidoreductase
LEFAGEVDMVGPLVQGAIQIGQRVSGIVGGGAQAEFVVSDERMLMPIPPRLDFVQGAALPEAFLTALDALESQADLRVGQRVLIHAVGSGVGTAAVQIAHLMGAIVLGTSRSAEKIKKATDLGLDVGIDTTSQDFADVVKVETHGAGVNAIIDLIGASALAGNLASLSVGGRLVLVGNLGGSRASLELAALLTRRIKIIGTVLRSRTLEEKIELTQRFCSRLLPEVERGRIGPVIDGVFSLEDVRLAHERMAANASFGKIILQP